MVGEPKRDDKDLGVIRYSFYPLYGFLNGKRGTMAGKISKQEG